MEGIAPSTKQILWLDNDQGQTRPFVMTLRQGGYAVDSVRSLTEAELLLKSKVYNLLILDVMIPSLSEEEEAKYPPDITLQGRYSGISFFSMWKELLHTMNCKVLVMSVLEGDSKLAEICFLSGLQPSNVKTKVELRDASVFLKAVQNAISTPSG